MTGFEQLYVSHHQFLVQAGTHPGNLLLFTVGDRLVQLTGDGTLTVLTGPHSARLPVRVTVGRPGPIGADDAASEATLFCDRGTLSVGGLMGHYPAALSGFAVQAGLVRVRVHAQNRRPDEFPPDPDAPERYEVFVWPVTADEGVRTIEDDVVGPTRTSDPALAATWGLQHLLARANPSPQEAQLRQHSGEPTWRYPRVEIRRDGAPGDLADLGLAPDGDDLVLPAGDVELRFRPESPNRATVRWTTRPGATVAVPDAEPSRVELSDGRLVHKGVRAEDAVPLGLVWDYLLGRTGGGGYPWEPVFAEISADAARKAARARRQREKSELERWGGRMPSPRVRTLVANTHMLWRLDPDLVEALAAATHDEQRAVARWSARRACEVSRLDTVGWIAEALAALDRDEPLPFGDQPTAFQRLLKDPDTPNTVVRGRDGRPNWSQQALAFPALIAAADPDPLVAAVDAVGTSAWAHGDDYARFLLAAHAYLKASSKG